MSKRIIAGLLVLPAAVFLSSFAFWRPRPKREPTDGPEILPPDDYRALLEVLATYCSLRNWRASIQGSELVVEGPDGRARYSLREIAQECQAEKRDLWPQVIGRYFAAAEAARPPLAPPGLVVPPAAPSQRAGAPAAVDEGYGVAAPSAQAGAPRVRPSEEERPPAPPSLGSAGAPAGGRELAATPPEAPPRVAPQPPLRPLVPLARRPSAPPRPAPGPTGAEGDWEAFKATVQRLFRRQGFDAVVEADGVLVRGAGGQERRFEAPGLDRVPQELPREQWGRLVDSLFGEPLRRWQSQQTATTQEPPAPQGPGDPLAARSWEELREALAIQFFPQGALTGTEREETLYSDEVPGLLAAVVCCLPEGTVRVPARMVQEWGVAAEEVFATALANVRRRKPGLERVPFAPGLEGMCLEADDESVAARALLLGEDRECSGRYGALVALPSNGLLLVCPLRPVPRADEAVSMALMTLVERILDVERQGAPLLARNLYWYHGGVFTNLPYEMEMERGRPNAALYPPVAFLTMLEELAAG